jgi:hypothetical protein
MSLIISDNCFDSKAGILINLQKYFRRTVAISFDANTEFGSITTNLQLN